MSNIKVNCGNIEISNDNKICIIAGPCQLETEQHTMDMAGKIQEITKTNGHDVYNPHIQRRSAYSKPIIETWHINVHSINVLTQRNNQIATIKYSILSSEQHKSP